MVKEMLGSSKEGQGPIGSH